MDGIILRNNVHSDQAKKMTWNVLSTYSPIRQPGLLSCADTPDFAK